MDVDELQELTELAGKLADAIADQMHAIIDLSADAARLLAMAKQLRRRLEESSPLPGPPADVSAKN